MKQFIAALPELFRPLMTLLLPGVIVLIPGTFVSLDSSLKLQLLADSYQIQSSVLFVLFSLTAGEVLEDLGARLEVFYDEYLSRKPAYRSHTEDWFRYLSLQFEIEPVGHRYLRTLVLRLKFELSMSIALLITVIQIVVFRLRWPISLNVTLSVLGGYLLYESMATHRALSNLRRELLNRLSPLALAAAASVGGKTSK